jgi:hypothetical protein
MDRDAVLRCIERHDPEATRRAYAATPLVDLSACCDTCENFWAAVGAGCAFPAEFVALAQTLGIDLAKPAELYEVADVRPGWHLYEGWYHFVGTAPCAGTTPAATEAKPFLAYLLSENSLAHEAFRGQPLVQLEFQAVVPWVLAMPPYSRPPVRER